MEASEISTTIKILNDPGIFQKFLVKGLLMGILIGITYFYPSKHI